MPSTFLLQASDTAQAEALTAALAAAGYQAARFEAAGPGDALLCLLSAADAASARGALDAAFTAARALAQPFKAAGRGSILLVAPGFDAAAPLGGSIVTHAAAAFSKALAFDLGGAGVTANLVTYGGALPAAPLAALAAWLAGEAGRAVTGQVLHLEAGRLALLAQPRPQQAWQRDGGWTAATLAARLGTGGDGGLAGKVCLVTGGGRGLGRAVALQLAAAGAKLVVNDYGVSVQGEQENLSPADEVVAAIRAGGGEAVANPDSVSDPAGVKRLIQQALDSFGRLDGVVNNAGILRAAPFEEMTAADWSAVLDVHLKGSLAVSLAAAEPFRRQGGGTLLHMTSASGLIGSSAQANYCTAKLGIVGLSAALAAELAPHGVRSNCMAPSLASRMTQFIDAKRESELGREAFEKLMRSRESSLPEQVAPLAVYLMSDLSRPLTGQVFGARGNEVYRYDGFTEARSLEPAGGITPGWLAERFLPALQPSLVPLERITQIFAWPTL